MRHEVDGGTYLMKEIEYLDLFPYVGFPAHVENVSILRCSQCNSEMIHAQVVEQVLDLLSEAIIEAVAISLPADYVTFLRKRVKVKSSYHGQEMIVVLGRQP